jgi:hypothetical protein
LSLTESIAQDSTCLILLSVVGFLSSRKKNRQKVLKACTIVSSQMKGANMIKEAHRTYRVTAVATMPDGEVQETFFWAYGADVDDAIAQGRRIFPTATIIHAGLN